LFPRIGIMASAIDHSSDAWAGAVELAALFRECVECFGSIHQGKKEWDRPQRLLLAKLGIQQARLLAFGQIMGICDTSDDRDPRLDTKDTRDKIVQTLRTIIDRPKTMNRVSQFDNYGLKPAKKVSRVEPALDATRLEAFREQYYAFGTARSSSVTAHHWAIASNDKFRVFIAQTREAVDSLINMFDLGDRVDQFIKWDIRALGWHPVFDRTRAANDGSKLRLIKESCEEDYPQYAKATEIPMANLNQDWQDSYEAAMARIDPALDSQRARSETPVPSTPKPVTIVTHSDTLTINDQKRKRRSIFRLLRGSSWNKAHSDPDVGKDHQTSDESQVKPDENISETQARSLSDTPASILHEPVIPPVEFNDPFGDEMTKQTTSNSSHGVPAKLISSMASRHDHAVAAL